MLLGLTCVKYDDILKQQQTKVVNPLIITYQYGANCPEASAFYVLLCACFIYLFIISIAKQRVAH